MDNLNKIVEQFSPDRTFTRCPIGNSDIKLDDYIYPKTIVWHTNLLQPPLMHNNGVWQHPVAYWYAREKRYIYIMYREETRNISKNERDKERDEAIYTLACMVQELNNSRNTN